MNNDYFRNPYISIDPLLYTKAMNQALLVSNSGYSSLTIPPTTVGRPCPQRCELSTSGVDLLPAGFEPGENDVICGRGKEVLRHPGNIRYRRLLERHGKAYDEASSDKVTKSRIVSSVIEEVRSRCDLGGFVKKDERSGRWYEVGDQVAREKTGQA